MRLTAATGLIGISCCWAISLAQLQKPLSADTRTSLASIDASQTADRAKFVGDRACLPCHKDQAIPYSQTSHHLTSQTPTQSSILGSFASGKNILMIADSGAGSTDPRLFFRMDAKENGFYQTAVAQLNGKELTRTERMDLVIGSGVRGQTYLYWAENRLSELPVSYWSDGHQWINSPGYRDGTANFARHVDPRCLECHTTYIKALSDDPQTNLYDKSSLVAGISCETCHGPGSGHVTQEQTKSPGKMATPKQAILNPAKFNRDRQIDQCALCHNGTQRAEIAPAFSFSRGRELDRYLAASTDDLVDHPDVHGNQVGLLMRSKCFLSSPAMTCSTCHNIHAPEQVASSYSQKCLTCHQWQRCGASKQMGERIVHDCISCHMPLQQTSAIVSETAGKIIHTSIRTHWIKVYPEMMPVTPHGE